MCHTGISAEANEFSSWREARKRELSPSIPNGNVPQTQTGIGFSSPMCPEGWSAHMTLQHQQLERDEETARDSETCPECDGTLVSADNERFCEDCGLVIARNDIDYGPDWRSFDDDDESERRVGPPLTHLRHDRGLETEIGYGTDTELASFSGTKREQLKRMSRLNRQAKNGTDRGLIYAFQEISRMGTALGLPDDVQERAAIIHRKAVNAGLLKGRSIESFASAAIHIAARNRGYPRQIEELFETSESTPNRIWTALHVIQRQLDIGTAPADPRDYLPKFIDELEDRTDDGFETECVLQTGLELLQTAINENYHTGNKPTCLAGGAIYAAALKTNNKISQGDVGAVCDASAPAIRKHYRRLLKLNGDEVEASG